MTRTVVHEFLFESMFYFVMNSILTLDWLKVSIEVLVQYECVPK